MFSNYKDKKIICSSCGEKFRLKGNIKPEDMHLKNKRIDPVTLFEKRNELLEYYKVLVDNNKRDEANKVMECLFICEKLIVDSTDGNSFEAYKYYGFEQFSIRCPSCREKIKSMKIPK